MSRPSLYLWLHWTAHSIALLVAGFVFLFYFGEGKESNGSFPLISQQLSLQDGFLLVLVLGSALAMLLAWIWEKRAGAANVLLAGSFLVGCALLPPMHKVWFLGLLLMLPGILYVSAAALRSPRPRTIH